VLLTADSGLCVRFPVSGVRVFAGRSSQGVRGIKLGENDRAISMTILEHVEASPAERAAYLKRATAERRTALAEDVDAEEDIALTNEEVGEEADLSEERYEFLKAHEQFVLTVTEYGYGKRSSSYDFRVIGRGGKGIRATDVSKAEEIGPLIATFPVGDEDQIMLVSDGGTVIRVPVAGIRIASRATKGVTIFNTAEGEKVVSVERISEPNGEEEAAPASEGGEAPQS
jgi:DNA gyrase subunit A